MGKHEVEDGETTSGLAKQYGFLSVTLWDHPENAQLKALRKDMNVLKKGDILFVPERRPKQVSKGTDAEHKFKIKGEPAKLKIQLFEDGKPRANAAYTLVINNELTDGVTDANGMIVHFIPPDATSGQIIMKNGREVFDLDIGALDPISFLSGVQQRLTRLGYNCAAEIGGEIGDLTRKALRNYQTDNKLEVTGEPNEATKAKLMENSK